MNGGPWLVAPLASPQAALRLLVCPSAGSGVAPYVGWLRTLGPGVDARIVLLPGRESRLRERPRERLDAILPDAMAALDAELAGDPRPVVLYGHSMGALLAFELARALEARGRRVARLVVSGRRAPHLPEKRPLHVLPEAALVAELRRFGGTPEVVLQDRELLSALLPAVRADLAVTETYVYPGGPKLAAPISAFGGSADPAADEAEIAAWGERTSGAFEHAILAGGHFFVSGADFQRALAERLRRESETASRPLSGGG
jgi:medium-chain acyl-[acyl-carrier-protein] hydrolase